MDQDDNDRIGMQRLSILWLTRSYPYPPAHGGDFTYSRFLIESAATAGADISVLYASGGSDGPDKAATPAVQWVDTGAGERPLWRSLLSSLPNSAAKYYSRQFRVVLDRYIAKQNWDAVIFDHFAMLAYMRDVIQMLRPTKEVPQLIYLSHNHEESVRWALVRESKGDPISRLAFILDAVKGTRLERSASKYCDLITTITEVDRSLFETRKPDGHYLVLKPGYEGPRLPARQFSAIDRMAVIFGSFVWIAKRQNLQEFLDEASKSFPQAGIRLRVVGPMDDRYRDKLRSRYEWVEFGGAVDKPETELALSRIGIVPDRIGGGFKLKTLNYIFSRNAVASLDHGMAGLPLKVGQHYIGGQNIAALCKNIVSHMDHCDRLEEMASRAYTACAPAFDWADRGVSLIRTLKALRAADNSTGSKFHEAVG